MTAPLPRAVIFDWDNTLVETWPVIHAAMNATLTEFGRPAWTLADIKTRVRRSMRETFPELFGDEWEKAGEVFHRHFRAIHLRDLRPAPGAEALLKALRAAGVPCAVVSNKTSAHLHTEAEHLGWSRYFARLVGAGDAARDKPAPEPVMLALEALGAGPPSREIWFAGDTDIDLECAAGAGLSGVLIRPEPPGEGEFDGLRLDRYCPSLAAFSEAVGLGRAGG
ncbi:MAG: HAD family hydrolase [Rhodospirillales bacterium]